MHQCKFWYKIILKRASSFIMKSVSKEQAIKLLKEKKVSLFTVSDAKKIFEVERDNTLYKILQRLEKAEIIKRIKAGKYHFLFEDVNDYEIANFIIDPSYVSLESALSFYGILSQFPYTVTSLTVKRGAELEYEDKKYEFSHIKKEYFFGFTKRENFLIATPQKALFDEFYFMSRGLRNIHLSELDLEGVNKKKFKDLLKKVDYSPVSKIAKKLEIF